MAANLKRVHHLVPKAFQVNAQNLHERIGTKQREIKVNRSRQTLSAERTMEKEYLWKLKHFTIFDTISQSIEKNRDMVK